MRATGILDSLIGALSPRAAYQREAWAQARERLRGYDAGGNDRLNAGWRAANQSAITGDRPYRDLLRARARDLERNSDIMGGVLTSYERNVVGSGFRLQAKTGDKELDVAIEELWRAWCKPRNCDVTGSQSFWELCRMALRRKKVDGGFLFVKRYTRDGPVPFTLQCVDVDELDVNVVAPHYKKNRVVDGVEVDASGRHAGYWIRQYDLDGLSISAPVFIPAEDAIFYRSRGRPSQVREISELAASIGRIRDMNSYMEAVSVKERIAACFGIAIKRYNPAPGTPGRGNPTEKRKSPYKDREVEPGMMLELEPGDEVSPIVPASQGSSAGDFLRLQQRLVGAGLGLGYETVSRDMSQVNYSSARQGLIEDNMTYAIERQAFIEHVLDEIYETFVISAMLSGALNAPGFWEDKARYLRHVWTPSAKPWIDPLKEVSANKVALESSIKTFAQIANENGQDWREQIDELAEIQDYARQKNVVLGGTKGHESIRDPAKAD